MYKLKLNSYQITFPQMLAGKKITDGEQAAMVYLGKKQIRKQVIRDRLAFAGLTSVFLLCLFLIS